MRFRDRPLLVDGLDADLYVQRPVLEHLLLEALARRRNVLLLGPPGSGKSTTLRKLTGDLRKEGRQVELVNAGAAKSADDLLALVSSELDLQTLHPDPNLATPVVSLVRSVRHLAQAPESVILLDDPLNADGAYELFGRLREELWALPHQWVVALRSNQSSALRRPPADAFFSETIEIPPLDEKEIEQMLHQGLDPEEAQLVLANGARPLMDYPREVARFARQVLQGTVEDEQRAAHRRAEIALGLGRTASMALAEIETLGAPVAASDPSFLERMGWTRPHASRTLAKMEDAGVLRSFTDATENRPGQPRKLYEVNPHPPT
ncbi:MAG: ATP-binding protein [Solirubrobacteraceae bacterium]